MKKRTKVKSTVDPTLTDQEFTFVEHYIRTFNKTAAAIEAGYKCANRNVFAVLGFAICERPHVKAAIELRLKELKFETDAIWHRLADQAMASLADFVDVDEEGAVHINFKKAQASGRMHLLKRLTFDQWGQPRVEMVDTQAALIALARISHMMEGGEKPPPDEGKESALDSLARAALSYLKDKK